MRLLYIIEKELSNEEELNVYFVYNKERSQIGVNINESFSAVVFSSI